MIKAINFKCHMSGLGLLVIYIIFCLANETAILINFKSFFLDLRNQSGEYAYYQDVFIIYSTYSINFTNRRLTHSYFGVLYHQSCEARPLFFFF